ncbi:MAG: L-seryl-tRNA(Sec) selenium transferase [Deltaproteobacteria bacterium]|nr:L-seryl-tRNA(Sec) selenium transferase [Deltaproteobacteria bacterium]
MDDKQLLLRQLPAVDRILQHSLLLDMETRCPRVLLVEAVKETVAALRKNILESQNRESDVDLSLDKVAEAAAIRAQKKLLPSLRHVINATGTLLHTNLGRAPLSDAALCAVEAVARSYSNLELDLETGKRGHRYSHVDELLCRLTGAEAAAVVNNNAGAVLLALTALARGREAVVSRGEMIEIGGSFRIPDVMEAGGVLLREIGTTNKTHLEDYRSAINENTGLLLKVHTSNYRIVGFTTDVTAAEMVALGREHRIPVMEDLGSGMLFDLSSFGLPQEPTVSDGVAAGIDVLTFSGDKLLGGPQAGIIVGKKWAIDEIRHHPLARALRIGKLTLAALEATLRLYLDHEQAVREIPVLRMLSASSREIEERCHALAKILAVEIGACTAISVEPEESAIGGGALPLTRLPGFAVALKPLEISVDKLGSALRQQNPPVIGRIQEGALLLNLRTVLPAEEPVLIQNLKNIFNNIF